MPVFLQRYTTPLLTGLFLISLITGIALFLDWRIPGFRSMHEWLSLVLILPFVLHLWKNWRSMLAYFGKAPMSISLGACLLAGALFMLAPGQGTSGGPPHFAFTRMVLKNPPSVVAPLIGLSEAELTAELMARGYPAFGQSLIEMAQAAGKSEMEMTATLLSLRR